MPKQYSALIIAILLASANKVPAAPCPNNACAAAGNMVATATSLSASERDGLLLMREEEKLAHDVYQALSTHWQLPIFANIRSSEMRHNTAIQTLLKRYGLADPSTGRGAGDFANPQLQALYTQLLQTGSSSETAALRVGAQIEELDIADLQRLGTQTDKDDIRSVYSQLERASRNHLRSFVRQLHNRGRQYVPQYLSAAAFTQIVQSPMERGGGQGSKQGRRQSCQGC